MRTRTEKFVTYAHWRSFTDRVIPSTMQFEFYDYRTAGGRAETDNAPDDPRAAGMLADLRNNLIPNELRAPLPGAYRNLQFQAREDYLKFAYLIENPPDGDSKPAIVKKWLGFGQDF
jgi:uncharacterized sulfatase